MGDAIVVRDYRPQDFDRLVEIDRACFEPEIAYSSRELAFYIRRSGAVTRIAEIEGKIAGFAVGRSEARGISHVITLDVVEHARRLGVGTALMESLHEEFRARGARVAILEVSVKNCGAIRFYEELGYQHGETLAGYYNGRTDALRMFLFLEKGPAFRPRSH